MIEPARRVPTFVRGAALISAIALAATGALAADKPVDGSKPRPGFTPPKLIGVRGEGSGPRSRPIPFPSPSETWCRVASKHFMILSSAGERRTRAMAAGLETLAAALTNLAPGIASTRSTPVLVLVFTRHAEVEPYFDYLLDRDDAHVSGLFVDRKGTGSMIVEAGFEGQPGERTPYHELVHSLLERNGTRPPLWLEEGLAEYFGAAELRNGSLHVGEPQRQHLDALRRGRMVPLAEILKVTRGSDLYNLPEGQRLFYAESWAAVDALMRAAGDQRRRFYDFVHDVETGQDVERALQSRLGLTVARLDQTVRAYGGWLHTTFGSNVPIPGVDVSATATPLRRDDLLYELGSFLHALDPDSSEAVRHFNAALEINPANAFALAALGRYDEAIAADPRNPDIDLAYADSLLGTQIGPLAEADQPDDKDAARFRHARDLAATALSLGGDEARARADYGVSFMLEPDTALGPAIDALRRAHALAPERTDYAVHLFAFLRRTGDRAEPLLAQLLATGNTQVGYAARAIVVRTGLARANALARQEKLDEAAAVIRDLAGNTPDDDVRDNLLQQAAELERTAATNRQITLYNDAVRQVNAGKYADARKTLTALLATATDPGVIRDAEMLQRELRGK